MCPELAGDEEPELELGSFSICQQRPPWEIQLLFWTGCIFSSQSHFESNNDFFLSPGYGKQLGELVAERGLGMAPDWSTEVPAVRRRRRRPQLLLPLTCNQKLRKNNNWINVSVLRSLSC